MLITAGLVMSLIMKLCISVGVLAAGAACLLLGAAAYEKAL